jgi:protein associated with RNAse G/E
VKGLVLDMDIKINGNLQLQNEYKINSKDMESSREVEQKSVVFSRNVDAFKKAFETTQGNLYSSK